jgi:hypothetical protein
MEQQQKPEEISPRFHNNQGFSVVVALAMGLLMTLLALTILFRTQNDRLLANKEGTASKSLEAADAGAAYYQSLLFRYPILATFNSCDINDFDGECTNPDLTTSWRNITRIAESSNACTSSTTLSTDDRTQIQDALNWRNLPSIPPDNDQNKKYRVVSYQYNETDSTGTLIVESQVSLPKVSNASVTGGTSSARVAVRFGVKSIFDPRAKVNPLVRLPGIWAKSFSVSGIPVLKTDICDSSGNNGSSILSPRRDLDIPDNLLNASYKVIPASPTWDFPNLPDEGKTATSLAGAFTAPNTFTVSASKSCTIPTSTPGCPFYNVTPDTTSSPPTSIYRYVIPAINVNSNASGAGQLTLGNALPALSTVIIRVNGNITLASGTTLRIQNGARVIIYLSGNFSGGNASVIHGGQPEDFQIYKYGSGTLTFNSNTNPSTNPINAVIVAPNATTRLNSNPLGPSPKTQIRGGIWTASLSLQDGTGILQAMKGFSGSSNIPGGKLKLLDDSTNPTNPNGITLGNYITVPEVWERCPLDVDYSNTTNPSLCIPDTN